MDNHDPQLLELEATVRKFDGDYEMYYLQIPALFGSQLSDGKRVRLVCMLAGKIRVQCALHRLENGDFFITINKKNRQSLGLKDGSRVEIRLAPDHSKYGLDMPEELGEMLIQEPEADRLFHELTAGRQRSFIFWVSSAKSSDKRLERALTLVEKLQLYGTKVTNNQVLGKA